jgi:hypothetical protein
MRMSSAPLSNRRHVGMSRRPRAAVVHLLLCSAIACANGKAASHAAAATAWDSVVRRINRMGESFRCRIIVSGPNTRRLVCSADSRPTDRPALARASNQPTNQPTNERTMRVAPSFFGASIFITSIMSDGRMRCRGRRIIYIIRAAVVEIACHSTAANAEAPNGGDFSITSSDAAPAGRHRRQMLVIASHTLASAASVAAAAAVAATSASVDARLHASAVRIHSFQSPLCRSRGPVRGSLGGIDTHGGGSNRRGAKVGQTKRPLGATRSLAAALTRPRRSSFCRCASRKPWSPPGEQRADEDRRQSSDRRAASPPPPPPAGPAQQRQDYFPLAVCRCGVARRSCSPPRAAR